MKIDSHLYPPPSTGEGEGGGGRPDHVPPHLNPLPPRGEEALDGVIFWTISPSFVRSHRLPNDRIQDPKRNKKDKVKWIFWNWLFIARPQSRFRKENLFADLSLRAPKRCVAISRKKRDCFAALAETIP